MPYKNIWQFRTLGQLKRELT